MQEHFQKTESVPKDFVTVEGVTSYCGNNTGTIGVSHCPQRYRMLLKQLVTPWFSVAYFPVTAEVGRARKRTWPQLLGLTLYYDPA
jgi:hypothetical protein